MSTPTDAEIAALDEAGLLLRYAAEHVDKLDPDLSLAIAEAMQAKQDQQWTPAVSQRFWAAFHDLCNLIKPITIECLVAADQNVESRSLIRFWRSRTRYSLAERTSSRYLILLFWLLLVVTPLQLYVWISTNITKKLDDLVTVMTVGSNQVIANVKIAKSLAVDLSNLKDNDPEKAKLNTEDQALLSKILDDSKSLAGDAVRSFYFIDVLSLMSTAHFAAHADCERSLNGPDSDRNRNDCPKNDYAVEWSPYATALAQEVQTQTVRARGNVDLISGIIISFLLPILFGTIGAVAYVIRAISDQIRATTFSKSSPIRHVMRIMLGALMGAVIGLFTTLSAQASLPPLALAFLAGYGVEAVFSMFDAFVERFRQSPATAPK